MTTPNLAVVRHYKSLIHGYFDVDPSIEVMKGAAFSKGNIYSITLGPEDLSEMILREVGILMARAGRNSITDGIYDELLRTKCCRKSYLRGAFLAAGTLSNPEKGYNSQDRREEEQVWRLHQGQRTDSRHAGDNGFQQSVFQIPGRNDEAGSHIPRP